MRNGLLQFWVLGCLTVRVADDPNCNPGITFVAPGFAEVIFEVVGMILCEIDDSGAAICKIYRATLESDDPPSCCS